MIVLHGSWLDDQWFLWGEGAPRKPADGALDNGPPLWGCAGETLLEAAAAITAVLLPSGIVCRRVAWLPACGGQPLPSQPWQRRAAHAASTLRPYTVWALPLPCDALFDLLAAAANDRRLGRGILAGHTIAAWADLLRYAGAIIARRQFLPDIRRAPARAALPAADAAASDVLRVADTSYEARWTPALDKIEQRRFSALAAGIAPAAVCLTVNADVAPAWDARVAAAAFLDEAVDRLVRLAVVTTLSRAHAERGRYASAHDAWSAALRGERRTIRWENDSDIASLAAGVAQWRRPLELERHAPYTLALTLTEPAAENAPWLLACSLVDDYNKETPWQEVWQAPATTHAVREGLLLSLGQAALLAPLLSAVAPSHVELDTAAAHSFMRNDAPLLDAAGFIVRLPPWWRKSESRIQLMARVASGLLPPAGGFSLATLVDVDWQLAIGETAISETDLAQLLAGGGELVRFRGRWLEIDRDQAAEALRLWHRRRKEARRASDIVRMMLGIDRDHRGLAIKSVASSGWLDDLLRRLRGDTPLAPLAPPRIFCGTLRPYQERGYAWLAFLRQWGLGACLADDMGLGKTIQALVLVANEREKGERRPALLVCPTSVLTNWQREAARFVPQLSLHVHHGLGRSVGGSFVNEVADKALVITSYSLLYRDYGTLRQVDWAGVILDEAQNIKNPDTRQAQAARALRADYRVALTGTPIENHVGDLWSIMDFLNPGLLGTRSAFREAFAVPIRMGVDMAAADRLRQMTAPFVLRRLKTDRDVISDLPAKQEASVYCNLTREQAGLYQGVLDDLVMALKTGPAGISRRGLVLASITSLKQVCNHPAHYLGEAGTTLSGRSGKLERLREMLEEVIASGEAALVFTQYAKMGALLQRHLQREFGCFVPFLHGGTPRSERDALVSAFQAQREAAVFVLSLKAGGTGLNLTRASHVFHFDRWWNPAVENQATDRAFRIGQNRNVMVHKFVCAGTMEERIEMMIREKSALAADIITSGEAWLTKLDDDALAQALALAHDAVGESD